MPDGLRNLGKIAAGLLTALLLCAAPTGAQAESLVFRNDTKEPLIVQAACVVRGVLKRDRPYLLKPGDSTPGIVMPGNKVITVYDGLRPNKVVFKGAIPGGANDQAFNVSPDPTGGVKLDLAPMPASDK
jgi:hypothetical protein